MFGCGRRSPLGAIGAIGIALALAAVQFVPARARETNLTRGCVTAFDPAADYFPDKIAVEDAVHFAVTYYRSFKVVEVRGDATGPRERYVLVQCGTPPPRLEGHLAGARVVTVPIDSLYAAPTTHLAFLKDLGRLDVLSGVAAKTFLVGEILRYVERAGVREFAPAGITDVELVVSRKPALFIAGGSSTAELDVLRQAGVPVVGNHEWLEPTALARAEWLKYLALFLNEEQAADKLHAERTARYRALSARARAVPEARKPTVMAGRGTRGDFVIAGGRSYVAALIDDAGGRYVWADNTAEGTVTIDLEAQLQRAGSADIWINGGGWANLAAMAKDEPRYGLFKAWRDGQVWVYERAMNASGGNDYWTRGVSRPDLLLADLVKIFHPSLVPAHEFQWYQQVPR